MKQNIGILNYNVGNLYSLKKFFNKTNNNYIEINKESDFKLCDKIILPGQGAYTHAMEYINKLNFDKLLKNYFDEGKYILGICLGMQLLMESSDEHNITKGLNYLKGRVIRLNEYNDVNPIPHIGWKNIQTIKNESNIIDNLNNGFCYFSHSYYCDFNDKYSFAKSEYHNLNFVSAVQHKNIIGAQFHPELSGKIGYKFLMDFVNL